MGGIKKEQAPTRWFTSKGGGSAKNSIRSIYERMKELGYGNLVLRVSHDYYPLAKRLVLEAGLLGVLDVQVVRISRKRPKCTYKTVKRDCAKRNR